VTPTTASSRTLHTYNIHGVALEAYDETGSESADRVSLELFYDAYGFERIPFAPGDVVIDIGAHVGMVSIYLAKRWPFLRIHAFEPHPANHRNCADNLRANDVANVQLSNVGVSADRRPLTLRSLIGNTGGATAVFDMPGAHSSPAAASVTLDDILDAALAPGQRCRLLKIDCEGIEYEILPSPILERVDFLAAEFHEDACGSQARAGRGRAHVLIEQCARYVLADNLRVIYCRKTD
jgi:FkbM family methyltransferase